MPSCPEKIVSSKAIVVVKHWASKSYITLDVQVSCTIEAL
jgi:hypothetical protein